MVISPMTMHHIEFAKTTNSQSSAMQTLGGSWPGSNFYRFQVEYIYSRPRYPADDPWHPKNMLPEALSGYKSLNYSPKKGRFSNCRRRK